MAYQSFRLALAADNNHAEAYNNLGVLEFRKSNMDQVLDEPRTPGSLLALPHSLEKRG